MTLRYLLLLATLPVTLFLYAQETPVKVSDFDYGITGESVIRSVQSVSGTLYGSFNTFYGDDNAGLISRLDSENGSPTSILDPDVTQWFGGLTSRATPNVFSVGDKTFAIQSDQASGNNLYSIDGDDATLLLSNTNFSYSEMVMLNDSIYFVVGGLPLSQSPNQSDSQVAELWRTDGTPEGTRKVTTLLSFFNSSLTHLAAGENGLMISVLNGRDQVFYLYDVANAQLGLVFEGLNQFILDQNTFDTRFNPIEYYDGGYYVAGKRDIFSENQVFRIDEESFEVNAIDLPVVPDPFFVFEIYDQLDFVSFQDSLYLFAGRTMTGNGVDLYQIQGENGLELEGLLVNSQTMGTILASDEYLPVIEGDTLFFLNRRPETDLALYAFSSGMEAPEVRAILDGPAETGNGYSSYWLNINDENFYASSKNADGFIFRVNRTTGVRDSAAFSFRSIVPNLYSPLAALDGDLFFINSSSGTQARGLYRWEADSDAPALFGNYITGNNLLTSLHGYSATEDLLTVGVDSILKYDPVADAFSPLLDPRDPENGIFSFIGEFSGELYYISDNNNNAIDGFSISKLENGVVSPVPTNSEILDIAPAGYLAFLRTQLNDSTLVSRFQPDGNSSPRNYVIIKFREDGLFVTPLAPADAQSERFPRYFADGGFSFEYVDAEGVGQVAIFDNTGTEVLTIPMTSQIAPRAVSETGVFMESINPQTLEQSILFFSFTDPANPETLSFPNAVMSANNSRFYVVGGNLILPAISQTVGQEWHVAIPGSGEIVPLVDVSPGTQPGIASTVATRIGDSLFFNANDGENGNEPWITDGTPAGTRMLADLFPGEFSSNPRGYTLTENTIFFAANGPQGYEVYRMGTGSLTPELIINLNAGDGDSHPYGFTLAGEDLYFMGREAAGETYELYRIAFDLVPTDAEPTRIATKVFPNPVREQPLTVQAPEGEELTRLQLFNQQGQLLKEVTANGVSGSLALENLPAGTYWLRSWYDSGRFSINSVQRVK